MKANTLSDCEFIVLGLVAEMPRYGYELEQVIESRGMREWTEIAFSSIYFVLGKLERADFVHAASSNGPKARKTYTISPEGREALISRTVQALATWKPTYSSVSLGMLHWNILPRDQAIDALAERVAAVESEIRRLETVRLTAQPQPDFVESLFDFTAGQLRAELEWIQATLAYMQTKP
jgi:DNA-binding PadR family transcriptional regulator